MIVSPLSYESSDCQTSKMKMAQEHIVCVPSDSILKSCLNDRFTVHTEAARGVQFMYKQQQTNLQTDHS